LTGAGVDTTALITAPDVPTGLAIVMVADDGENAIAVVPGANAALATTDVDALREQIEQADVLLMQLEVPFDSVARAAEIAAAVGTTVVLNLAPAADLPAGLFERLDVLVVNRSEAEFLDGSELTDLAAFTAAGHRLRERGPAAVVITAGGDGAVVADGEGDTHVPALEVEVVDTTGAGDAFVGVLAAQLAAGASLREATGAATRAAAETVQHHGAQPSLPGTSR
jgi:ribokinase